MQGWRREPRNTNKRLSTHHLTGGFQLVHLEANPMQPDDGTGFANRKVDEESCDEVSRTFGTVAHTRRYKCPNLRHGRNRLTARLHPFAQRSCNNGENDIVNRATVCLANCLEISKTRIGHSIATGFTDRTIQRIVCWWTSHRQRSGCQASRSTSKALRGLAHVVGTRANRVECNRRAAHHLGKRIAHQVSVTGLRPWIPWLCFHNAWLPSQVQNHLTNVERTRTVDHRVVCFGQDREAAARQPFDQIHLPERAIAVEWTRHDSPNQFLELFIRAWLGKCRATHVEVHVEIFVVNPYRVSYSTWHPLDLLAIARHETNSGLDQPCQPIEVKALFGSLKQHYATDVHRRRWLFEVQEGDVQ